MGAFAAAARGAGVALHRTAGAGGWRRTGVLVTRVWDAGFTEAEYQAILRQGRRGPPDAYTVRGAPIWWHSAAAARQAQRDLDRRCLDRTETHNVACNAGRSTLLNFLGAATGLTGVTYFAVGTGTLPASGPSSGDTQLVTEVFRKGITSVTVSGNQVLLACNFLTTEGNYTYTEAGLFGGSTASGTANSGTLFAHAAYVYSKSSSVSLTNDYTLSES